MTALSGGATPTDDPSGTERAVFGTADLAAVRTTLDGYAEDRLRSRIAEVLLRAGRIDAVWAVRLEDGREVVITAHRGPVDLVARRATCDAQRLLARGGFPCAVPIDDTSLVAGLVLTTETWLTDGDPGDGREPEQRRALAAGLAEQVELLRAAPELIPAAGPGPAWCRYREGAWPVPHDPIFEFRSTPAGYGWLDDLADAAAARLRAASHLAAVVGHADWCMGNTRFAGRDLVGAFDWDLVAAPEPMIAGFAAAAYTEGGSTGPDLPSPAEVVAFLRDYESARGAPFTDEEQEVAAAATTWTLAYNARCQLGLQAEEPTGSALDLARRYGRTLLTSRW